MKNKTIAIALVVLIAILFVALFWRGCTPRTEIRNPKSEIQKTDTIPGELVTAPTTPPAEVVDPALEGQVRHFRQRYEYYKGQALALQERLQALDAALADTLLSCEERQALLRAKIAAQDEAVGVASGHIEELSNALEPKRDTGSQTTAAYRFQWEINHFGTIMDNGFRYQIDVLPQPYTCPDCPTPKRALRRNLSAFYGMGLDGRQRYALEARRQWRRVSVSGLVLWDGEPSGLVGVGWSW
jgi:hypothetical protein